MPPPAYRLAQPAVSSRLLTAEAVASAALALVQSPAVWTALATISLMCEAAAEYEAEQLGAELGDLLAGAMVNPTVSADAVALLETVDRAARTWAQIAHPRNGTVPFLGTVA